MMYDFETLIDRSNTQALAVEVIPYPPEVTVREGVSRIPMWVADMNFATVPTVQEEIIRRVQHPCFGYFLPSDEYFDSILRWQKEQHGVEGLTRRNIGYENGVLGGVASAMEVLCSKGDHVLLHSPTYIGFTSVLENNGYHIVHSPLVQDEEGIWRMDYEDMDRKLQQYHIHTAVFCSPHNPCGRVWERWEIEKAMEVYRKNDVYVISDEIWSDLTLEGYDHIPTQSVSEDAKNRTIAFYAPSKTFNLAGLIGSYRIVYNPWLRDRMYKQTSLSHYDNMNVTSMHALIGAYRPEGAQWLEELRRVLTDNVQYAWDYIQEYFPGVRCSKPQGTYMMFLDCTEWCEAHEKTIDDVLRAGVEAGVIWQDGRAFHGPCHIRLNLALPFHLLQEAMERMKDSVFVGGLALR